MSMCYELSCSCFTWIIMHFFLIGSVQHDNPLLKRNMVLLICFEGRQQSLSNSLMLG